MGLPPTSYPRTPPVRRRGLLPCSPLGMHRLQLQVVLWQETGSGQYIQSQAYGCTEQTENAMLLRQKGQSKDDRHNRASLIFRSLQQAHQRAASEGVRSRLLPGAGNLQGIVHGESDFPSQAGLRALLRCPSQLPGRLQLKPKPSLLRHF